jgi:hypothetical protein
MAATAVLRTQLSEVLAKSAIKPMLFRVQKRRELEWQFSFHDRYHVATE